MDNRELVTILNTSFGIDLSETHSFENIHGKLAVHLNELINKDFERLVAYLYRIDVSEHKLKALLQQHPGEDAGNIMATLIMERELEKIKTRKQFSSRENDLSAGQAGMDEEEKW